MGGATAVRVAPHRVIGRRGDPVCNVMSRLLFLNEKNLNLEGQAGL